MESGVALSFTEVLDGARVRMALAVLVALLIGVGGADLGQRLAGPGPRLEDCLREAVPACLGREFHLGGTAVVADDKVALRVLSRQLVTLDSWPSSVPYPASGAAIAVRGIYRGGVRLEIIDAAIYPLSATELFLGVLAVITWLLVFAGFTLRRWQQRVANG